jgi:hypothetical protein
MRSFPEVETLRSFSPLGNSYVVLAELISAMMKSYEAIRYDLKSFNPDFTANSLMKDIADDQETRLLLLSSLNCCWSRIHDFSLGDGNIHSSVLMFVGNKLGMVTIWRVPVPMSVDAQQKIKLAGVYFSYTEPKYTKGNIPWISNLKFFSADGKDWLCVGRSDGIVELCSVALSEGVVSVERKFMVDSAIKFGPVTSISIQTHHGGQTASSTDMDIDGEIDQTLVIICYCQEVSTVVCVLYGDSFTFNHFEIPAQRFVASMCFKSFMMSQDLLYLHAMVASDMEPIHCFSAQIKLNHADAIIIEPFEHPLFQKHVEHLNESILFSAGSKLTSISYKGMTNSPCGLQFGIVVSRKLSPKESELFVFNFPMIPDISELEQDLLDNVYCPSIPSSRSNTLQPMYSMNIGAVSLAGQQRSVLKIAMAAEQFFEGQVLLSSSDSQETWKFCTEFIGYLGFANCLYKALLLDSFIEEELNTFIRSHLSRNLEFLIFSRAIVLIQAALNGELNKTSGLLAADFIIKNLGHPLVDSYPLQIATQLYGDLSHHEEFSYAQMLKADSSRQLKTFWDSIESEAESSIQGNSVVLQPFKTWNKAAATNLPSREKCPYCDAKVSMESLSLARCANNHQLDRCVATIQVMSFDVDRRFHCTSCEVFHSPSEYLNGDFCYKNGVCPLCFCNSILE